MSCIYARGLPGAEVLVRQEQLIRLKRDRGDLLEDTADILQLQLFICKVLLLQPERELHAVAADAFIALYIRFSQRTQAERHKVPAVPAVVYAYAVQRISAAELELYKRRIVLRLRLAGIDALELVFYGEPPVTVHRVRRFAALILFLCLGYSFRRSTVPLEVHLCGFLRRVYELDIRQHFPPANTDTVAQGQIGKRDRRRVRAVFARP